MDYWPCEIYERSTMTTYKLFSSMLYVMVILLTLLVLSQMKVCSVQAADYSNWRMIFVPYEDSPKVEQLIFAWQESSFYTIEGMKRGFYSSDNGVDWVVTLDQPTWNFKIIRVFGNLWTWKDSRFVGEYKTIDGQTGIVILDQGMF